MKEIIASFWINILSSIVFGFVVAIVAIYPLSQTILNSIGVGVLAIAVALTLSLMFGGKRKKVAEMKNNDSKDDMGQNQSFTNSTISNSEIYQGRDIHIDKKEQK